MATVFEVLARFKADVTNYTRNVQHATDSTVAFEAATGNASRAGIGAFAMLGSKVGLATTAIMGLTQTAGMMGIRTAMANEQAAIGFKVMLGSAEQAKVFMNDLIEFAAKTPFELPQLRSAASALLSTGVEAERIIPIMEALGDATSAKGYGAEAIGRAVYALQQMSTAGRATGQDMMQLTQAGLPIWESLASSLNKTIPEVRKLGEQGKISAEDVMKSIEAYAGPGMQKVKGMMVEQAGTLQGLLSTLKDTINQSLGTMMTPAVESIKSALPAITTMFDNLLKSVGPTVNSVVSETLSALVAILPALEPVVIGVGKIFTSVMSAVAPLIPPVVEMISSLTPVFEQVAEAIRVLAADLVPIAQSALPVLRDALSRVTDLLSKMLGFVIDNKDAVLVFVGALAAFRAAMMITAAIQGAVTAVKALGLAMKTGAFYTWLMNTALYANPIGVLVAAIAGLVVAVVVMYKKFEWFRNGLKRIWNAIVEGVQWAINLILGYWEFWINRAIAAINLLIKAWNLISWGDDVETLEKVNFQLDITAAKVDIVKSKTEKATAAIEASAAAWRKFEGFSLDKKTKDEKPPPTPPGDDKTQSRIDKLRQSIERTYVDAINKAKAKVNEIRQAQDAFRDSIQQTITANTGLASSFSAVVEAESQRQAAIDRVSSSVAEAVRRTVSLTGIMDDQRAAAGALAQAQQRQYEIAGAVYEQEQLVARLTDKANTAVWASERAQASAELADALQELQNRQYAYAESTKAVGAAEQDVIDIGQDFLSGFEAKVKAAEDFANKIIKLRELNLSDTLITQIAEAGAVAGGAIADELIAAGAAGVARANELQVSLEKTAKTTGVAVGQSFADSGFALADAMFTEMEGQTARATAFADKIKTLVQMGLSYDNLQQVISAGSSAGTTIADALIKGGSAAIPKANALQTSLKTMAASTATAVSSAYYKTGEAMAQAIVDGLEAKWKALAPKLAGMKLPELTKELKKAPKAIKKITSKPIAEPDVPTTVYAPQISPTLEMSVPSIDFTNIDWSSLSFDVSGLLALAQGGIVTAPTIALVGEKGPEAVVPLTAGLGQHNTTIYMTVEANDPQAVVDALRRYYRQNGAIPVGVSY